MAEQGGVGIVFHASRSGRCLLVFFQLSNVAVYLHVYLHASLTQLPRFLPNSARLFYHPSDFKLQPFFHDDVCIL
jgi:hypothetical protein